MNTRETIAKNATVMLVTQLTTWVLALILNILLPRYLGDAAIGQFHTANSLWAIAAILIGFGMDQLLTKEIARDTAKAATLMVTSAALRVLLAIVAFGGMAVFLQWVSYPTETQYVVWWVGLATVIWQSVAAVEATAQGLERMEIPAVGSILGKLANVAITVFLLLQGYSVVVIAAASCLSALLNLIAQVAWISRSLELTFRWQGQLARQMLRDGLPYLASGLFLQVYTQFDIVVLSLLVGEAAVGWYGAADVLFGTMLFIPTVFVSAVFPALSRLYAQSTDGQAQHGLSLVARKGFDLLVIMSLPIGLGMIAVADQLVVLLYGDQFANSGPILALFGIVLIFTYLNMLLGRYLISMDRQNQWTLVMAVATVCTLPLDLWLIPHFDRTLGNGGVGGALSFIMTEVGMTITGLILLPRGTLDRRNAIVALKATAAGLCMLAAAWALRQRFILIPVAAGAAVYVGLSLVLGVLTAEDRALLVGTAQGLWRKRRGQPVAAAGADER